MTESVTTKIDTTIHVSDATRAAAARVLTRTGNADLLDVLGLDDAPALPPIRPISIGGTMQRCPVCRLRTRADGMCRRGTGCEGKR